MPGPRRTWSDQAAVFGPRELARIGRKILDVIAPEIAEAEEAKRLRELENDADALSRLTMRRLGDGTTRISARLSDAAANRLTANLHAFTNPRQHPAAPGTATGTDDAKSAEDLYRSLPHPKKLARAFTQLLEVMDTHRLPVHGGNATTILITIGLRLTSR